jgi:hypothetical protein
MAGHPLPVGALRGAARAIQATHCPTTKRRARRSSNGLASSSSASTRQACEAYGAGRLETVTTVPHEDLILCEAVIVFEAYAPPARTSPFLGLLACRPALECALVTAPTSRIARIMRPVLGDACWAAVMAHANAWLQCAVSGEVARAARSISRSRDVATGMCPRVWNNKARGAGAEASGQ